MELVRWPLFWKQVSVRKDEIKQNKNKKRTVPVNTPFSDKNVNGLKLKSSQNLLSGTVGGHRASFLSSCVPIEEIT